MSPLVAGPTTDPIADSCQPRPCDSNTGTVRLSLTWNDVAFPAIAPLDIWRTDPLKITAAPRARAWRSHSRIPRHSAFSGKLVVRADGENSDGPAVQIGKGQDQAHLRLPLQTGTHQVLLADEQGSGWHKRPPRGISP